MQCWVFLDGKMLFFQLWELRNVCDVTKTECDPPVTTSSTRDTCNGEQLGSATGSSRASKGRERNSQRHPRSHQKEGFRENTEIIGGRRTRRKGSLFFCHKPKLFHNRGNEESVQSLLIESPFSMGLGGGGHHWGQQSWAPKLHWSAQEIRTGVWPSSFFWASANPRWPLKQDSQSD